MSTLLYRFDNTEDFLLLESETTARGLVAIRVDGIKPHSFLRIAMTRHSEDPPEITVLVALPLIAIDGKPQKLLLDVLGDAGGCHLFLEAGDAQGWGFAYSLGSVDFTGWRTCTVDVQEPGEYWGERREDATPGIIPPLQLYRLGLTMSERCRAVDVGLGALNVTGDVRLAPPGIASTGVP